MFGSSLLCECRVATETYYTPNEKFQFLEFLQRIILHTLLFSLFACSLTYNNKAPNNKNTRTHKHTHTHSALTMIHYIRMGCGLIHIKKINKSQHERKKSPKWTVMHWYTEPSHAPTHPYTDSPFNTRTSYFYGRVCSLLSSALRFAPLGSHSLAHPFSPFFISSFASFMWAWVIYNSKWRAIHEHYTWMRSVGMLR